MKKILFDGLATQGTKKTVFHGGGEYAKFILRAAIEKGYKFDIVLSEALITDPNVNMLLSQKAQIKQYKVKNIKEIYDIIDKYGYDVFYSALPYRFIDYASNAKFIGVIHGLRAAELPWDFYRYKYESKKIKRFISWAISHCSIIQKYLKKKHIEHYGGLLQIKNSMFITVSNHSKYSILNFFQKIREGDIKVLYSPFEVSEIRSCEKKDDFFLMVSGGRYEKNIYRAIKVFDKLFTDGRLADKRVVITGCGNQPFWKEIVNKERFELLPYVSQKELDKLYKTAFCYVYPSLNEGFGYPPLQAMSYGTPVIASSATSIPEVCASAVCYFSPTSEDDLAARILQIDSDSNYRESLIQHGLERVKELQILQNKMVPETLKLIFE